MTDVRVTRARDSTKYLLTDETIWFNEPSSQSVDDMLAGVPEHQRFAADIDDGPADCYAGIYGVRPMELCVPGGDLVPMAGMTWVGVHPDSRRRGVLTAMLRDHFVRTRSEGVALSGLHASEPGIYGRHGYGVASTSVALELGRGSTLTAPQLDEEAADLQVRMITPAGRLGGAPLPYDGSVKDWAVRLQEWDRHDSTRPGLLVAQEGYYRALLTPPPETTRDQEPLRFLIAEAAGAYAGHAAFRRKHKWEGGRPGGELEVFHLSGSPAARLRLLRRLLDSDLMGTIAVPRITLDDPVQYWLGHRAASLRVLSDNLWLRIIDLPAAIAQRSYDADCNVVVRVVDSAAPWVDGVWRIEISGGAGTASATDAAPDLELPISTLGSLYLGGGNLVAMHQAGQVTAHRPDAVAELHRAFRTDTAPAASMMF